MASGYSTVFFGKMCVRNHRVSLFAENRAQTLAEFKSHFMRVYVFSHHFAQVRAACIIRCTLAYAYTITDIMRTAVFYDLTFSMVETNFFVSFASIAIFCLKMLSMTPSKIPMELATSRPLGDPCLDFIFVECSVNRANMELDWECFLSISVNRTGSI